MGFAELVCAIVFLSLIFGLINNIVRRRYQALGAAKGSKETAALLEIEKMRQAERDRARETYERLAKEKLEVIQTALTMGYQQTELDALDTRLEKLIGAEQLTSLLDKEVPEAPQVSADLMDAELAQEVERLAQMRKTKA